MTALLCAAFAILLSPRYAPAAERLTDDTAREALIAGHVAAFGREPSPPRLRIARAHVRYEGHALPGRNVGAITVGPSHRRILAGGLYLGAFDTYALAAEAYWRLLGARCKGALAAFDAGDPEAAAERLARCGYHTTAIDVYARGLRGCLSW